MNRIRQTITTSLNTRKKVFLCLVLLVVLLALSLFVADRLKGGAEKVLKVQTENMPVISDPVAEAYRLVGMATQQHNDDLFFRATAIMRKQVEKNPDDDQILANYGWICLNAKMISENLAQNDTFPELAREMFTRALELNPRNQRAYEGLGNYYILRDRQKALENYIKAYELEPDNWNLYVRLGMSYYETENYTQAKKIFNNVLEYAYANDKINLKIQANEYLGRIFLEEGAYETAQQYLETSASQLDRHQQTHFTNRACPYQALGKLYMHLGKEASETYNTYKAADLESHRDDFQYDAAEHALLIGDYQNALKYIDRALAISSKWRYWLMKKRIQLAMWFADWRNIKEDEFDVRGAVAREMTTPEAFNKALHFFQLRKFSDARVFVDVALEKEDRSSYRVLKGFIFLIKRKYKEAERQFDQAIKIDSEDLGARIGQGHLNIVAQDYDAAMKLLLPVADEFSSDTWQQEFKPNRQPYDWLVYEMTFVGLGWVRSNQNQHEQAVNYFDYVLKYDPADLLALLGKGNSLIGLNRLPEAERLLKHVLDVESGNPYALAELGTIMLELGRDAEAAEYFRAALEVDSTSYTCPYEGLGLVMWRQGRMEEAKVNLQRAIDIDPDIEYRKFNALAEIYIQEGRYDEAEKLLLKSMKNYPFDDEAKKLLEKIRRLRSN